MLASQLVLSRAGTIMCVLINAMTLFGCVKGDYHYAMAPAPVDEPGVTCAAAANKTGAYGIDAVYKIDPGDLFSTQPGFKMLSSRAPRVATADVNGDGFEDIFICGGNGIMRALYLQVKRGVFKQSNIDIFENNAAIDMDCAFFDADGDNDADLYVCSGYNALQPAPFQVFDRLYLNDGKGNFTLSCQELPAASGVEKHTCVAAADFDADGDIDLYIGVYVNLELYGYRPGGYLLQNDGNGIFTNATEQSFAALNLFWMITDARWFDYDKDGRPDLVLAGENMPVKIFHNTGGKLLEENIQGLQINNGCPTRLVIADVNQDDYPDIIAAGNCAGSKLKASVLLNDKKRGFALKQLQIETQPSSADTVSPAGFDINQVFLRPGIRVFLPN